MTDASAPPTGRVTLVLGGARSGKSTLAESLAGSGAPVTYVATGGQRPDDPEWVARVAAHQARRPPSWTTVETTDLGPVLRSAQPGDTLLVDCLTLWLTARLDRAGAWSDAPSASWTEVLGADVSTLLTALQDTPATVVLVSNEVGQGVVPGTASGRLFRDEQGRLNIRVAEVADRVVLVVAGQPLLIKGAW